jgi:hypothetical protein
VKINKKSKQISVTTPLFSTGSGRTTISEVIIKPANKVSIRIEPYSKEKLYNLINDFCDSFYNEDSEDDLISIEIERAIRSIINLKKITKKTKNIKGKTVSKTIDQAKVKSEEVSVEEFKNYAFKNAKLDERFLLSQNSVGFAHIQVTDERLN